MSCLALGRLPSLQLSEVARWVSHAVRCSSSSCVWHIIWLPFTCMGYPLSVCCTGCFDRCKIDGRCKSECFDFMWVRRFLPMISTRKALRICRRTSNSTRCEAMKNLQLWAGRSERCCFGFTPSELVVCGRLLQVSDKVEAFNMNGREFIRLMCGAARSCQGQSCHRSLEWHKTWWSRW